MRNLQNSNINSFLIDPPFNLTVNSTRIFENFKYHFTLEILIGDNENANNFCLGKLNLISSEWECIDDGIKIQGIYQYFYIKYL